MNKRWETSIEDVPIVIEAEQEGDCRYMVRMHSPGRMARVRIGYLTGGKRQWTAEIFGRHSVFASSAKTCCFALAREAADLPTIKPYLTQAHPIPSPASSS